MYPFLRLAKISLLSLGRRRLEPLAESRVRFLVWPNDIDTNLHLNNGRYLTLMDLGRWDLALRTGMVGPIIKHKWTPLMGAAHIRWLRPLPPFKPFELCSRLLCWDEKWFYVEQRFEQRGRVKATALGRFLLRDADGNVPPRRAGEAMGFEGYEPAMPDKVRLWVEALESARKNGGGQDG